MISMSMEILELMKTAALDAVKASRPVNVHFGTVKSVDPLTIELDQKILLTKEFLVLSRNVTEHDIDMTVDHITEDADEPQTEKQAGGGGDAAFASHLHIHHHKHPYVGRKTFRVHKGLKLGERIIAIALQGGGKYLIWDRVGDMNYATDNG